MRLSRLWILPVVLSGWMACDRSDDVTRLADTYVDLLRFRESTTGQDTAATRIGIDSLLTEHGFTPDSYQTAFSSLFDEPKTLPAFFERVDQRIAATNPVLQSRP